MSFGEEQSCYSRRYQWHLDKPLSQNHIDEARKTQNPYYKGGQSIEGAGPKKASVDT